MGKTLFDKIWDAHVVQKVEDGPTQLYIDRLYAHEVTSPQAFDTLRDKGVKVFRPDHVWHAYLYHLLLRGSQDLQAPSSILAFA